MGVPPERSLHASMWAPHSHHDNDRPSAYTTPNSPASMIINPCPNDWICPSCEGLNFQRRTTCFQCSEARPQKENQVYMQPAFAASCPSNATPSQPPSKVREPASSDGNAAEFPTKFLAELENGQRGLASSRFASKAYKTCTNYKSQPNHPPIHARQSSLHQDHTLPFDVQNYILTLLTHLLEDSLFRFTTRYLPSLLTQYPTWTCPQAVELSVWRAILPSYAFSPTVPPRLRTQEGKMELERGLVDAVRIRNIGVHREGCGNVEMGKLMRKAGLLCGLLGDEAGGWKCEGLERGVVEWGRGDEEGRGWDERRGRLEGVLRGVGEKEVDEMEWNAVEVVGLEGDWGRNVHSGGDMAGHGNVWEPDMEID